jgi:hypothetical protein
LNEFNNVIAVWQNRGACNINLPDRAIIGRDSVQHGNFYNNFFGNLGIRNIISTISNNIDSQNNHARGLIYAYTMSTPPFVIMGIIWMFGGMYIQFQPQLINVFYDKIKIRILKMLQSIPHPQNTLHRDGYPPLTPFPNVVGPLEAMTNTEFINMWVNFDINIKQINIQQRPQIIPLMTDVDNETNYFVLYRIQRATICIGKNPNPNPNPVEVENHQIEIITSSMLNIAVNDIICNDNIWSTSYDSKFNYNFFLNSNCVLFNIYESK